MVVVVVEIGDPNPNPVDGLDVVFEVGCPNVVEFGFEVPDPNPVDDVVVVVVGDPNPNPVEDAEFDF